MFTKWTESREFYYMKIKVCGFKISQIWIDFLKCSEYCKGFLINKKKQK